MLMEKEMIYKDIELNLSNYSVFTNGEGNHLNTEIVCCLCSKTCYENGSSECDELLVQLFPDIVRYAIYAKEILVIF